MIVNTFSVLLERMRFYTCVLQKAQHYVWYLATIV